MLILLVAIAIGVGGIYAVDPVFENQGRAAIPLCLLLYWGGLLLLVVAPAEFLIRLFSRT
jgi:hypothetical protein